MPASAPRTAFLYSDALLAYDLGPQHPLKPRRLRRTYDLLDTLGLFAPSGPITLLEPVPATEDQILRVHTPDYVNAVRRASNGERGPFLNGFGLGPGDTPAFDGMYEASALYSGSTAQAARLALSGEYDSVFSVAGGVNHHAWPGHASGFGTFNDLAVGIQEMLAAGVNRIACIDIDVHHGDGTQACFYSDSRVLTISLHESGRYLFPGSGFVEEIGEGAGVGANLNIPFLPYTLGETWHDAFDQVVPRALASFKPEAIFLQLGADAHWEDPLAHLMLTSRWWMKAVEKLLTLVHGLPLVVTGGGGYNVATVTRLWTMVAARLAGIELPNEVPAGIAKEFGFAHLHDTTAPGIDQRDKDNAQEYMQKQVDSLISLM